MAQQTEAPRTTNPGRRHHPREEEPGADPPDPAPPTARVSLERLLTVVMLNPAQASLVAARLLVATRGQGTTDGRDPVEDCRWSVFLTPSGEVEVTRSGPGEGAEVAELLEQLSHNARQLPAHPDPAQLALLRTLEEVTADQQGESSARALRLDRVSTDLLGSAAAERLTGDIGALVGAFAHVASSTSVPAEVRAATRALGPQAHGVAATRASTIRSGPPRSRRRRLVPGRGVRSRRMVPAVLLLVAAVAGSGYVVLRNPDTAEPGANARGTTPATPGRTAPAGPATRPPSRGRPAVATLAARQSGAITGVEVQRNVACTQGALCPVTTTVRFRPAATPQPVVWRVGTVQGCGSGVSWSSPITVTARPGWTSVYASSSVTVPRGRSVALVALTSAPARAQSPPVPVTGSSLRC